MSVLVWLLAATQNEGVENSAAHELNSQLCSRRQNPHRLAGRVAM